MKIFALLLAVFAVFAPASALAMSHSPSDRSARKAPVFPWRAQRAHGTTLTVEADTRPARASTPLGKTDGAQARRAEHRRVGARPHPLWMYDRERDAIAWYELDTVGNVRRLRGGPTYLDRNPGPVGSLPTDLGGYRYTAFGKSLPADAGTPRANIDQPLRWQGRWFSDVAGGIYDVRNRQWSPELGAFLTPDEFRYFHTEGTLWSWPNQNPLTFRDPNGRFPPLLLLLGGGLLVGSASSSGMPGLEDPTSFAAGTYVLSAGLFAELGGARGALEAIKNASQLTTATAAATARTCSGSDAGSIRMLPENARRASGADEVFRRLQQFNGIDPILASERLHQIKHAAGLGPAENVVFDLSGGVYDPYTLEFLGSLTEGGAGPIP